MPIQKQPEQAAFIPAFLGGVLGIFLFGGSAYVHGHSITSVAGLPYAAGILACIAGPIVISQIWYSIVRTRSDSHDLVFMTLGTVWLVAVFAVAFWSSFLSADDVPRIFQNLWAQFGVAGQTVYRASAGTAED